MKPSSSQESRREVRPLDITLDLSPRTDSYSYSNRRQPASGAQRIYPFLLFLSTLIAGVFCFAYITKPVFVSSNEGLGTTNTNIPSSINPNKPIANTNSSNGSSGKITKNTNPNHKTQLPPAPLTSGYEETNIRMQHILDAQSPTGDVKRIVIDVPALYKSRNLRWTQEDAAQARVLLKRLEDYQEKSSALRDEGKLILQDWNKLMDSSVPNPVLRADSPSVSTNLSKTLRAASATDSEGVKIQNDTEAP